MLPAKRATVGEMWKALKVEKKTPNATQYPVLPKLPTLPGKRMGRTRSGL